MWEVVESQSLEVFKKGVDSELSSEAWFSSEPVSTRLKTGLQNLRCLFQDEWFYDSPPIPSYRDALQLFCPKAVWMLWPGGSTLHWPLVKTSFLPSQSHKLAVVPWKVPLPSITSIPLIFKSSRQFIRKFYPNIQTTYRNVYWASDFRDWTLMTGCFYSLCKSRYFKKFRKLSATNYAINSC